MDNAIAIISNLSGIAALVVAIGTLYSVRSTKRKNDGDAAKSISEAAANVVETMTKRLDDLESDLSEAKKQIGELLGELDATKACNEVLQKQNREIVNAIRCTLAEHKRIAADPNNHHLERVLQANVELERKINEVLQG